MKNLGGGASRAAARLELLINLQEDAGRVTGGETVTAADARAILRAAVKLEPLGLV